MTPEREAAYRAEIQRAVEGKFTIVAMPTTVAVEMLAALDAERKAHAEVERVTRERDEAEGARILNRAALKNALARVAELEAIQRIAHVQVDGDGDLWLHLDGGKNYKASVNVSAKFATHRGVVHGGVRQAAEALRALLATAPPSDETPDCQEETRRDARA